MLQVIGLTITMMKDNNRFPMGSDLCGLFTQWKCQYAFLFQHSTAEAVGSVLLTSDRNNAMWPPRSR